MKKLFLTLTMLLFAFMGTMKADVVEIGSLTGATNNSYLPMNSLYEYSFSEQIYTAAEIGNAGTINEITMWLYGNANLYTMPFDIYMVEVDKDAFATTSDWVTVTAADKVYSGQVTVHNTNAEAYTFTLDTPFQYNGQGNLVIAFLNKTGQWKSGLNGKTFGASGDAVRAIYARRDSTPYDIANLPAATATTYERNVINLDMTIGGGTPTPPAPVTVDVITDPIDLNVGYRPVGYWMEPYTFKFYTEEAGTSATITSVINGNGAFMPVALETPATISDTVGAKATVTTGTAAPGRITEEFAIDFNGRSLKAFQITGDAYQPVEGDVWELAIDSVDIPFTGNAPAGIYKNYNIENSAPDAADVIYKLTFENEVMLNAGTNGANGVARLYTEDFNGQPGPMVGNHFEYSAGGGYPPYDDWFGYDYNGSNTFFGTQTGGGMFFGYKVPVSLLNGYGHCYLTQVEAAAREAYPYDLYVLRGGETPADAEIVYYQEMPEPATALYFFDMEIDAPFEIGQDEDLWVLFYSESPYAAYCGKDAVDTENAKIWYTLNGTTWISNPTYTPVIYLRLQYPNPAERGGVVLNLADMSIKPFNGEGTVAEAKGEAKGMPVHRSMPVNNTRAGYPMIYNQFVPAGTYYLAVASTEQEFDVYIETEEAPAPEQPVITYPTDGTPKVPTSFQATWELPDYVSEMQVLLGTQYPPQTVLVDWTNELFNSYPVNNLEPSQSYFMQVNVRNATGTASSEISAFTTVISPVEGFAVESDKLYPGDAAVFTWEANRSFQGYNIYCDSVKMNEELLTTTTYTVEDLAYNMTGYNFQITSVYDAGESEFSDPIVVKMTGNGTVTGHVYDIDETHPIANATIEFRGTDEYGVAQVIPATANAQGAYNAQVLAGRFTPYLVMDGYDESYGVTTNIAYNESYEVDIYTHEFYYPLTQITATEQEDETVLVEWSWTPAEVIVDFETGDFSQANFNLPATYPWAITTTNAHEGTYAIKSTCEGVASGSSIIEATVDVPFDGKMGFWVKVSSEANYDKFHFYIDGVEKGTAISGTQAYAYKEFDVTEGTHTYKWEYTKDSSVNSGDDCAYVDDITLYRYEEPLPPVVGATVYDFENSTMQGWTTIDANNDSYDWVLGSEIGGVYLVSGASLAGSGHNSSADMVCSGSYSNASSAAITPDNYLVSPQITAENGAQIQFWACAQDSGYPEEHFGVAVSTTNNTSASAFTMVQEWTMTAKADRSAADVNRSIRGTTAQGTWYQFSVDLSAYAGQDIYVAIRHFNCYDQFILNVDDITLATGGSKLARNDRSLTNYILYRMNLYDSTQVVVDNNIAADVMEYTQADWATLPFGMYQWGIQAQYEGQAPAPDTRDEVIIGEGATTNSNLPVYTYYNNSLTEQIYTADEIGTGGTINSVSFFNTGAARTRDVAVYMAATTKTGFTANNDWISFATTDKVFEGEVTFVSGDWTTITLSTPFVYDDASNLVIGVDDNTGSWESAVSFKADAASSMALYYYNDYSNLDPTNPPTSGYMATSKNQIKLDITPSGVPMPQNGGLSEILWSNVIEKDMDATLSFTATTNSGIPAAGATIEIVGENTYTATIGEDGTATQVVRKGDYVMTANFAGYHTSWSFDGEITADAEYEITFIETIAPVDNLYVSPTGWVKWDGATGGGVTPGPTPGPGGVLFTDDFEAGNLDNWTLIDNGSPTGYGWGYIDVSTLTWTPAPTAHSGNGVACSWSWNGSACNQDSYMITPMVDGAANITYYVATNTGYPDYYEIMASSTGTNISDFTVVFSETAPIEAKSANPQKYASNGKYTNGARDLSPWTERSIALPAGTKYVAIHHEDYDNNYLFIDDVTVESASKGGDRAPLVYKVMLDGKYDGETYDPCFQHNVEGLEEGSTHVTAVRPVYLTGNGDWMEYEWTYTACDHFTGVTDFTATAQGDDVKLTWTLPGGTPGPGPGPGPQPGTPETFTFDDSSFQGWTTIDGGSPTGYGWQIGSTKIGQTGSGHNSSTDFVLSQSYDNSYGVVYPNNFLICPTKGQYTSVSLWACGQDSGYAAEHFGIAVSTTGNTSASDFVMVQEWTIGSKGQGQPTNDTRSGSRAQSPWTEYTADLSAYAGQEIWVAVRHFNCSDMFYLDVDDITLNTATKSRTVLYEPHFVTDPGAMSNGGDASWIKGSQSTYGPGAQHTTGNIVADDFTLDAATTITEIEVYGYQTGSGTTSTFTGLYAVIYDGNPMSGGQIVWGDMNTNIMTATSFTNAYRGSNNDATGTTRPIMALTASNLNIQLAAGTYYLAWNMAGSGSSGPWAQPEAYPETGNSGNGVQYLASNSVWQNLSDGGASTPYGVAFKLVGEGGAPTPPPAAEGILGAMIFRDGEWLAFVENSRASEYVVEDAASDDAVYGIRVVYDGEPDVTYYAMSCMQEVDYTGTGVVVCDPVTNLTGEYMVDPTYGPGVLLEWEGDANNYEVFYNGTQSLGVTGETSIFIYGFPGDGNYLFGIVAIYDTCESEMETVTVYYDAIGENEIVNNLYPNPTNGMVKIEAQGMNHITVATALGQVVYDADVDADELELNLGQYNAGMYLVRISTVNGVSVKRVSVIK